ncbi:MAG: helix-turn-helix domain-containing protein [Oscillospiraceae bacterium]
MDNMQIKKGRKPKEKRYDSKFAEVLRTLLAGKERDGINLSSVADELGITRQSLAQYRDGNNIPDIVILGRMAEYFNVTTDYLLGRTPYPTVEQDLRIAEEVTGLSEQSINALCLLKEQTNSINPSPYLSVLSIVDFLLNNLIDDSSSNDHIPNPNTIFLIALAEYLSCEGLPENKEKIEYYIANGEIIISSRDGIPLPKYDLISLRRKNDGSMSSILTVKKIKQSELIEKMLFDGACEKMKEAKLYYEKQKGASDNGSNNPPKE